MRWFKQKGKSYSKDELVIIVREILTSTLETVKKEVIVWINIYVPKRTGQLRDSLVDWVNNNWKVTYDGLTASIGTNINYGLKTTGIAAHNNTWFEHSGQAATAYYAGFSKILLNDPQAISSWYQVIGSFLNERFLTTLQSYKESLMGG